MSRENREQTSARTANRSISSLRICSSCGDRASAAVPRGGGELIDPLRVPLYKATMHTLAHILLLDVPRVTTTHSYAHPCSTTLKGVRIAGSCESARDPESVVEDERMVARVMPGPAHLHDPELTLHPELALPREPEVEDSVDEVILFVLCICRPAWIAPSGPVRRKLSQQEGRAVQIPEPSDQGEHLPPRLAELREDLERVERIEHEEPVVERFPDPLRVEFEQVQPRLLRGSGQLLPQRAEVQDAQVPARVIEAVAEALRMVDQARPTLLEGHVEAARAVQGARMEDMVGERRLHRAGRAGDEDDVPFRDSASEDFVEPFDVRRDTLHFSSSTMSSSRSRIESICFWIRAFSCGMSTIAARLPRSMLARSALWTRSDRSRSSGFLRR